MPEKDEAIVDNSSELAFDDPAIVEFLAKAQGTSTPESKPETKPDVKPKPAASSAAPSDKAESAEPETPEDLKAQIKGLQAELSRRRGNSERVEALEQELQTMKSKLDAPASNEFAWIKKLDEDDIVSKQTDWDDELADARARYARAEENGDERALEKHGHRILQAKRVLSAFRKETQDRTKQAMQSQQDQQSEFETIRSEITDMQETVNTLVPDVLVRDSEAWLAGKEEYDSHPVLMKQLGPLGEVVACAMAILRNPDLASKKSSSSARKDVIGSLEKSVKKALVTGASTSHTPRNVDYSGAISSGDDLAKFNAMIDKIKGG